METTMLFVQTQSGKTLLILPQNMLASCTELARVQMTAEVATVFNDEKQGPALKQMAIKVFLAARSEMPLAEVAATIRGHAHFVFLKSCVMAGRKAK